MGLRNFSLCFVPKPKQTHRDHPYGTSGLLIKLKQGADCDRDDVSPASLDIHILVFATTNTQLRTPVE